MEPESDDCSSVILVSLHVHQAMPFSRDGDRQRRHSLIAPEVFALNHI